MDLSQRVPDRVTEALGALDAEAGGVFRLTVLKLLAGDRIGKRGDGAPIVDRGLRALGLELVQDRRELCDLCLVELELVREEAQRPADAEASAVTIAARLEAEPSTPTFAVVVVPAPSALAASLTAATMAEMTRLPPSIERWMHLRFSLAGP